MSLIDALTRRAEAEGETEIAEELQDLKEELRPITDAIDDMELGFLHARMRAIQQAYEEGLPRLREAGYPENLAHEKMIELTLGGSTPWPETPEQFKLRKGWEEN